MQSGSGCLGSARGSRAGERVLAIANFLLCIPSYSTFFDNAHRRHTGLAHYLEKRSIRDIYLIGLALDYCVKYSALDARQLGLTTYVILDGCRGIELEPGDIDRALAEMKRAVAILLESPELSG
jgi:nicotinamidase/pyrazinamidase